MTLMFWIFFFSEAMFIFNNATNTVSFKANDRLFPKF